MAARKNRRKDDNRHMIETCSVALCLFYSFVRVKMGGAVPCSVNTAKARIRWMGRMEMSATPHRAVRAGGYDFKSAAEAAPELFCSGGDAE